jgi:hypothetical protein
VETFENPQRQVDLDLWFLAGSDISYFLFYFFGSIFLRGRPLSLLLLLLSHSLSFHSLETKEEELEKRSRLARAAMGASPDQRAPLSFSHSHSLYVYVCVVPHLCMKNCQHRGMIRKAFPY